MTWLVLLGLAAACLLPVIASLARPARVLGRGEADAALYRAQLRDLDEQRRVGRIDAAEHAAAKVEAGRRALAAAPAPPAEAAPAAGGAWMTVTAVTLALPAAALLLYLWHGTPGLPSATLEERVAARARDEELIGRLRARIAALDPANPAARQGWLLLGNAERARGRPEAALDAWRRALEAGFDPDLAADAVEVAIEAGREDEAAALLSGALDARGAEPRLRFLSGALALRAGRAEEARRVWSALLAEAPADAPWRPGLEQQLRALP